MKTETMPAIKSDRSGTLYVPRLRWMVTADRARIMEIEQLCFDCPWEWSDFFRTLKQPAVEGVVAEIRGEVAGYVVYQLKKSSYWRRAMIHNLAVAPHIRRRGLGRLLVRHVQHSPACVKIEATIFEFNVEGQLFFRGLGFECKKILHDYFGDLKDGYRFVWKRKLGKEDD
jgi:ribosomal protein S18 acetylase RimI-like enzyme